MFCVKCGMELAEGANFCANCGTAVQGTVESAGRKEKETIIMEGLCNRVKSKLNVQNGHGMLTDRRFIYSKHEIAKTMVMGVLVNLTSGSYDSEIPISKIKGLRDGRQGFSKTIIISTTEGEEYEFFFTKRERWLIEFNNLIG